MADTNRQDPGASSPSLESLLANLRNPGATSLAASSPNITVYNSPPSQIPSLSPVDVRPTTNAPQAPAAEEAGVRRAQSERLSSLLRPNATPPRPTSNTDRATSLLNLLKFSQPKAEEQAAANTPPTQAAVVVGPPASGDGALTSVQPENQGPHGRTISASDLVASFMSKSSQQRPEAPRSASESKPSPAVQTQDYLLKLLNRPKPAQAEVSNLIEKAVPDAAVTHLARELADTSLEARRSLPPDVLTAGPPPQVHPPHPAEAPAASQDASQPLFTYVNPFDQLAASSPRNRPPKIQTPRPTESRSATPKFEILRPPRNASPATSGSGELAAVHPKVDLERALVNTIAATGGARSTPETVATALEHVGDQVDQEVEEALARAEDDLDAAAKRLSEAGDHTTPLDVRTTIKNAAVVVQKELDKKENRGALEETLPAPVAQTVKAVVEEAALGNVADSWESADAEDSPPKDEPQRVIRVYNFPIKPFVSLHLKPATDPVPVLRDDQIMDIARLKKDFDQLDRTLATSSEDYIVYAMSKHGGVRLIRQDDGRDKQVFPSTNDRVFNVSLAASPPGPLSAGTEAVLATGVSGAVYWFHTTKANADLWEDDAAEGHGFILPPISTPEDTPSGGQLKTRTKTSARHPEYFAVGRGKAIHLIWPAVAASPRYLQGTSRVVNTEKYLQERSLKITTGKAGKDFSFSEDDSTIASLDKLGRLRLWDIRDLVDGVNGVVEENSYQLVPVEVKTPLITFLTSDTAEKAWPSSVMFVDKSRPYLRGTAQRYMIVGLKQNHTLQLWDLALGKAVQELHFPHDQETDGICSVAYHAATGIIVVGHPTRNSIYLVHLSAPRYNLSPVSQARYIERLARKDPSLFKPEATAIMSGVREFSLANKGQLRSLDILSRPNATVDDPDDPVYFELYVMHSRGVSSFSIKREDLGWSKEGRVLHPIDAEQHGLLEIRDLREIPSAPASEPPATEGEKASGANGQDPIPRSASKDAAGKPAATTPSRDAARPTLFNGAQDLSGTDRADKRKKKREHAGRTEEAAVSAPTASTPIKALQASAGSKTTGHAKAYKEVVELERENGTTPNVAETTWSAVGVSEQELKKIETTVTSEFSRVIAKELDGLYRRFDEDKRIQQASGDAKQDAVLRLVSSTLSENVEKSLARMIDRSIQQAVLPSIADVTASSVRRSIVEVLREELPHTLSREIRGALPDAIARVMQSPDLLRVISELVTKKVAAHVEREFVTILHGTIAPAFTELALSTSQQMVGEMERRALGQVRAVEGLRQQDNAKIDQLQDLVRSLTQTVSRMADAQTDFQREILKLQRQVMSVQPLQAAAPAEAVRASSRQHQVPVSPQRTAEQEEQDSITAMMREERYEEATIQVTIWLQSNQQTELFDRFFVRFGPTYTQSLSPLVLLSVAATVSSSLQTYIKERLDWLEACFTSIDPADADVREVLPRIMDVLIQRLEGLYMHIAETNALDPVLRKIPPLTRLARELKAAG
ncbi:MAG: hypothetical protein M1838_003855 [Thelocarpon superellum]|nr:MAG: hypothetical protein M1838_003855 [Thelocarpon superellum]